MKDKILIFIIGILVGAIITTCGFMIYNKTHNIYNNNQTQMGEPPSMPGGNNSNGGMGQPPAMPNDNKENNEDSLNQTSKNVVTTNSETDSNI